MTSLPDYFGGFKQWRIALSIAVAAARYDGRRRRVYRGAYDLWFIGPAVRPR